MKKAELSKITKTALRVNLRKGFVKPDELISKGKTQSGPNAWRINQYVYVDVKKYVNDCKILNLDPKL